MDFRLSVAGCRMRELRSRLNTAPATKIVDTEIQQADEPRRLIFKDSRTGAGD
jgi:hypothetical protein